MQKIYLILVLIYFCANAVYSQTADSTRIDQSGEIFSLVEKMPEFPGGQTALNTFLSKNISYPVMAREANIAGKVWVSFIVSKTGLITDINILKGIGGGCDEEVLRVLKLMPAWTPGMQSGKPVNVKFNLPVNFTLK